MLRIDVEAPREFDWREQTAEWAPPDATDDYFLGSVLLRRSAHVWASRGITIFTNEEGSAVRRVVFYPSCSAEEFRRRVYNSVPVEERPLPS